MQKGRIAVDEFTSLIIVLPRAIEGRVCNLLRRVVAAEIVQHKLIKASTNIGHCHGLLRSYEKVYNPWDILNLFDNRKFEAYWFESGVPSFLYKVMMQRCFSPVQLTNLVVDKEFITAFDVKHIGFESLMFQTGYLTIIKEEATADGTEYTLDFPNHEVQKNFRKGLLGHLTKGDNKIRRFGDNLIGLLLANDFEGFTDLSPYHT